MPLLFESVRQLAAAMVVAALIIVMLIVGRPVLIPLASAIIVSFMLAPVVRRMSAWGLPRGVSVTGVVVVILFVLVSAGTLLSVELLSITSRVGDYRENLVTKVRAISSIGREDGMLKRTADTVDRLTETLSQEFSASKAPPQGSGGIVVVDSGKNGEGRSTLERLAIVTEPVASFALLILFTFFLLLQHQDMRDRVVRIAGIDNLSETTSAMSEAGKRLSRLFLAQAVMSFSYGAAVGVVLGIVGLPGAIVWGVLSGLMRFVPFIGPYIAAVPPIILAAGVDPGWWLAVFTAGFFIVSEILMGNVIEPLMLGRRVGLSPFAMIAAASFWTIVWGPVGLLLAAPLTMALVVLGRYIQGLSFVSVLLGDEPALEPTQELYHRLLSSDELAAAEQLETAIEESSLAQATDSLVLPALALAAHDARAGRLTDQQFETIEATLAEASELSDLLSLPAKPGDEDAVVIVVPARGRVDVMAARFLARVVEADTLRPTHAVERATGLTALSVGTNSNDVPPACIVIASVATLPKRQLQLMASRATRAFPGCRIIVLSSTAMAEQGAFPEFETRDEAGDPSPDVKHISTVVELVGNLKVHEPAAATVGAAPAHPGLPAGTPA